MSSIHRQEFGPVRRLELRDLSLERRADRDDEGPLGLGTAFERLVVAIVGQLAQRSLVDVADVKGRFRGQQVHLAHDAWSIRVIGDAERAGGLAVVEVLGQSVADLGGDLLDRAVRLEQLLGAVAALVHRLQVLEAELHGHRVDIGHRIDAVLDVHDVRVVEAPGDLDDRVHLADVRQELVAETFPLVRAPDEARDVDEVDRRRQDAVRVDHGVERREPRVGHLHDADVRLDGAEGVVRRFCLGRRQRVEERRLADVGESDDADR